MIDWLRVFGPGASRLLAVLNPSAAGRYTVHEKTQTAIVEIACSIVNEFLRSFVVDWTKDRACGLRPPIYLTGLNLLAGLLFLVLGIKGYWDNENRVIAVRSLVDLFAVSLLIAAILGPRLPSPPNATSSNPGEPAP